MKPDEIDQNLLSLAETIIKNCLTREIDRMAVEHASRGGEEGVSVNVRNYSKLANALYGAYSDYRGNRQLLTRRTEKETAPNREYYMYGVTPLGAHVALLLKTADRMRENKDTTETPFMRVMREHDRAKGLQWKDERNKTE